MVGRLLGRSVGWSVGLSVHRSVLRSVHQSVSRAVGRSVSLTLHKNFYQTFAIFLLFSQGYSLYLSALGVHFSKKVRPLKARLGGEIGYSDVNTHIRAIVVTITFSYLNHLHIIQY